MLHQYEFFEATLSHISIAISVVVKYIFARLKSVWNDLEYLLVFNVVFYRFNYYRESSASLRGLFELVVVVVVVLVVAVAAVVVAAVLAKNILNILKRCCNSC